MRFTTINTFDAEEDNHFGVDLDVRFQYHCGWCGWLGHHSFRKAATHLIGHWYLRIRGICEYCRDPNCID